MSIPGAAVKPQAVLPKYGLMIVFLAAFLGQGLWAAWRVGQTTDETTYVASGYPLLRGDPRFLQEHPPLSMEWGALPLLFFRLDFPDQAFVPLPHDARLVDLARTGAKFLYQMGHDPYRTLFLGRMMIVFLGVLLGVFVFVFTENLFGTGAGLFSLALYAFCPDILAHASLYTTDLPVTCFYFIAAYFTWRAAERRDTRSLVLAGVTIGLALLSKVSAIVALPAQAFLFAGDFFKKPAAGGPEDPRLGKVLTGLAVFHLVMSASNRLMMVGLGPVCLLYLQHFSGLRRQTSRPLRFLSWALTGMWAAAVIYVASFPKKYSPLMTGAGMGWLVISAALYAALFRPDFQAKARRPFEALSAIWLIAATAVVLGFADFPLKILRFCPYDGYLVSFTLSVSHAARYHMHCLEGSFISCDWRYFLGVMSVKIPLLVLAMAFTGAAIVLTRRSSIRGARAVLFGFPLALLFAASFMNKINIGVRHVLPVYPFLFVLAGAAYAALRGLRSETLRTGSIAFVNTALFMLMLRTGALAPDYLVYFNEAVGDAEAGARLVTDSNIDWGQDNRALAEYLKKNFSGKTVRAGVMNSNKELFDYVGVSTPIMAPEEYQHPAPGHYVLGIENYVIEQRDPRSWFRGKRPDAVIGKTRYLFEVKE